MINTNLYTYLETESQIKRQLIDLINRNNELFETNRIGLNDYMKNNENYNSICDCLDLIGQLF